MTIPARLGPYEVERELGAGAMGVVYLARDERLDRRVALKSLPEAFADDADRLARFEREARMLAALHHPHVASLFGLEELDGRRYLVMEYVEGEDLAARIARGAVDVEEATKLADQIARGLAAAHDAGIIHRDLKPGNVLVTPSGGAKVVDFGLAKDVNPAAPVGSGLFSDTDADASDEAEDSTSDADEPTRVIHSENHSIEPTVVVGSDTGTGPSAGSGSGDPLATEPGALLGTAAYMSPEQARGRPLDRRTDVWSFGCVVFEMLTRQRPFAGKNLTETILAVLQKEPEWDLLPERTPAPLRRLLERCLRKDPDERLRDLGDASLVLREIRSGEWPIEADAPLRRHPVLVALAAAALLALGALLAWAASSVLRPEAAPPTVRFTLPTPELDWGGTLVNNLAVAPDGRSWVYRDASTGSLFLRRLEDEVAEEIPHTEGAVHPFWSPDGRHLGFVDGLAIRRVEPFAGSPRTLVELPDGTFAGTPSWGPDGILYAVFPGGLHRVPAEGGESEEILAPGEPPGFNFVAWPEHVGDAGSFLLPGGAQGHPQLLLFSSADDEPVHLGGSGSRAVWVAPDRLVFANAEGLLSQRLDLSAGALVGDPVVIDPDVVWESRPGAAAFAAAPGLLVSVHRGYHARLQWFDATSGAALGTLGEPGDLSRPRISPSGRHVAVSLAERQWGAEDVWIFDLERDVGSRLTRSRGAEGYPIWSPDGERLAYFSDVSGPPDLRTRRADGGGEERILLGGISPFPEDWSPDGSTILYRLYPQHDLHFFSMESLESEPWLAAPGNQIEGRFSPDGRWIAFVSDELGPSEVFVAPRSDAGARRRVSTEGGQAPMWAPDGEQIYFHDGRRVLVTEFDPANGRVEGRPRTVLQLESPDRITFFDVAPDGDRLLLAILDEELLRPTTTVQVGWEAALPD